MNAKRPNDAPAAPDIAELWRRIGADGRDSPSPDIDNAILKAAATAAAPIRKKTRPWWAGWLAPVSVGAVSVLGLLLTQRVVDHAPRNDLATRAASPATLPAAPALPSPPIAHEPGVRRFEPSPQQERSSSAVEAKKRGNIENLTSQPFDAPPISTPNGDLADRGPQHLATPRELGSSAAPSALHDLSKAAELSAPSAQLGKDAIQEGSARQRAAASAAALSGATGEPTKTDKKAEGFRRAPLTDNAGAGPGESSVNAELDPREPGAWLKHIRTLVSASRIEEAAASMKRFRDRFPSHAVPDDLKRDGRLF